MVKELVENALDAQATRVTVEIQAGGRSLVRVADDGLGMSRDDALLSLTILRQQLPGIHPGGSIDNHLVNIRIELGNLRPNRAAPMAASQVPSTDSNRTPVRPPASSAHARSSG